MTQDDLIAAGYSRFPTGPNSDKPYAACAYQRAIYDGDKKAYFVQVYYYDVMMFPNGSTNGPFFTADANLYPPEPRRDWLTLEIHQVGEMTVAEMEAIFFAAWTKLGCVHDLHNN